MGLMQGLAVWLKQIIAVMLLAALLDLLLPNKTMQRYVRLVAGLFILLTVAAPVLQWLKGDFGTILDNGLKGVEEEERKSSGTLTDIRKDAQKLQESQMQEAGRLAVRRLEEAIRAGLEQSEGFPVKQVDVMAESGKNGSPDVKQVTVTLGRTERAVPVSADGPADMPADETDRMKPVEAVKPVDPPRVEEPRDFREDVVPVPAQPADRQSAVRVMGYLAANYGIPAGRITVVISAPDDG